MALQCQVKDSFSTTQDKSEVMKVQALITICAVELSFMLNILLVRSMFTFYPRWSKFSLKLDKLTNSSRSEKTSCFKFLELCVFVFIFIFLLDDNGTRSASISSSECFLVFSFA